MFPAEGGGVFSTGGVSCSWLLPGEVWLHVFGYLSHRDRLRVRAVCKCFRELVDGSRLWRDWTLTLRRAYAAYNQDFWSVLRRWRVAAVALLSSPPHWEHIAAELPQLHTLVLNDDREGAVESLRCFSGLTRLFLRRHQCLGFRRLFTLLPRRLTALSVCRNNEDRAFHRHFRGSSLVTATHLQNLTFLVLHTSFYFHPKELLPRLLTAFPRLTHLSVTPPPLPGSFGPRELPQVQHRALRSLEIVENVNALPDDVMQMVPCVRGLALLFSEHGSASDAREHCLVAQWLRDLPTLASLLLLKGPLLGAFVEAIPPSVTRLSLRPARVHPAELTALSTQLPDLQDLQLDPVRSLGSDVALIPRLFPGIRRLRLRLRQVPPEDVLRLGTLTELRSLETLDLTPPPPGLTSTLQDLSRTQLQVCSLNKPDRPKTCQCVNHLPSETWDWTGSGLDRD